MRKRDKTIARRIASLVVMIGILSLILSGCSSDEAPTSYSEAPTDVPVKGMPTMVDLGANECIPCKMMAPVMEKVEKKYRGKAAIVFIDVWKDKDQAKRFGIRAIPTQIFFDEEGKEVHRHEGFMGEADIDRVFKEMGVG